MLLQELPHTVKKLKENGAPLPHRRGGAIAHSVSELVSCLYPLLENEEIVTFEEREERVNEKNQVNIFQTQTQTHTHRHTHTHTHTHLLHEAQEPPPSAVVRVEQQHRERRQLRRPVPTVAAVHQTRRPLLHSLTHHHCADQDAGDVLQPLRGG